MKPKIKDSRQLQNQQMGLPGNVCMPATAHCCVGTRTPIQCHTGGTPGNVYFLGCLICGTLVISGLSSMVLILKSKMYIWICIHLIWISWYWYCTFLIYLVTSSRTWFHLYLAKGGLWKEDSLSIVFPNQLKWDLQFRESKAE